MALPNDQATRLGGALLTGGAGISAPYANLPAEIITRTLYQYKIFDFTDIPGQAGKSGAATVPLGTLTNAAGTYTTGWQTTNIGAPTLVSSSGGIVTLTTEGVGLGLDAGSVANTGWYATYSGSAGSGGMGVTQGLQLGITSYPRTFAIGGSMCISRAGGVFQNTFVGLATAGAGSITAPGVVAFQDGLVLEIDTDGSVYVVGRRFLSGGTKTRVAGMSTVLPSVATQEVTMLDWVISTESRNPGNQVTFGPVNVYLRSYTRRTASASDLATRPPAAFKKFTLSAATSTAIFQPFATGAFVLYPFVGSCNPAGGSGTGEQWNLRTLWYALERA